MERWASTIIEDSTILSLILYVPAFLANGAPVLVKGKNPLDLGFNFLDGKRLFGDGKTFEGLFSGLLVTLYSAYTISLIIEYSNLLFLLLTSGIGSLIGDLLGSFIKRRLSIPRGSPAPVLDQVDFVLGATFTLYLAGYPPTLEALIIALVASIVLHVSTNRIAYRLGLKDVPW